MRLIIEKGSSFYPPAQVIEGLSRDVRILYVHPQCSAINLFRIVKHAFTGINFDSVTVTYVPKCEYESNFKSFMFLYSRIRPNTAPLV